MARSHRVGEFDTWRPGYAGATVQVYLAGSTTPAALFSDPALTVAITNPQTLLSLTDGAGRTYGRFSQPVYVGASYQLNINGGLVGGIERLPLFDLDGADASPATVLPEGGTVARRLDALASDEIRVAAYGTLGASPGDNTVVLGAAIGAAAARGGGVVRVPDGTFDFTALDLPQNVRLRGEGKGVTTLRSTQAQRVLTLSGDGAGLEDLTLDGVSLLTGSVGIYAVGRTGVVLRNATIRRFATGMQMKGGTRLAFSGLDVSNCNVGADLRGDKDAGASSVGGPLRSLTWDGGLVDLCTTAGVLLSFEDDIVDGAALRMVDFATNAGTALRVNGARAVMVHGGRFSGNTVNLDIADDSDTSRTADNTVRGFLAVQPRFEGGIIRFDGTCDDVVFDTADFRDVDFQANIPARPILLLDCQEDAATTATGATEKLARASRGQRATFPGVTTDANYVTAWSLALEPGEVVQLRVRVLGRQRNGVNWISWEVKGTASRPGADIGFDTASGTLAVGSIVSGATSGASARIVASSQTGAAGTLTVRDVKGVFEVGETVNTSAGQSAKCTAPLSSPTVTVDPAHVGAIAPNHRTNGAYDATINASSALVRVQVKGATDEIVEWGVEVDAMRP